MIVDLNIDRLTDTVVHNLDGTGRIDQPFPHAIIDSLLDEAHADALLDWFEAGAGWRLQTSHFYNQYACSNLYETMPESCRAVLGRSVLNAVRSFMEERFATRLNPKKVFVAAHKLLPGQGIGIHTDRPSGGTETHRFVLHINRDFDDSFGGHLLFFREKDEAALAQIVRPLHNSAAAFALSDRSFHAVNDVTDGVRYSVIFSFWEEGAPFREGMSAHGDAAEEPDCDMRSRLGGYAANAVQFLKAQGADRVPHSHATLLDHLVCTAEILERWGADEPACLGGLLHSVYGTDGFTTQLIPLTDRHILRAVIGEEAERLAYLFCFADRRSLYGTLGMEGEADVALRPGAESELASIDAPTRKRLMAMIWANTLEQMDRMPVDAGEIEGFRQALARMPGSLEPAVIRDIEGKLARYQ